MPEGNVNPMSRPRKFPTEDVETGVTPVRPATLQYVSPWTTVAVDVLVDRSRGENENAKFPAELVVRTTLFLTCMLAVGMGAKDGIFASILASGSNSDCI